MAPFLLEKWMQNHLLLSNKARAERERRPKRAAEIITGTRGLLFETTLGKIKLT